MSLITDDGMKIKTAINRIKQNGALLVFPINNRKLPNSLWSELYPRNRMRWEWDDEGDNRVADLWQLMKRLSDSRTVVYSKWYQGRATFFSRELFAALLSRLQRTGAILNGLSPTSELMLEILESDSPLSTKELKRATQLQGRFNEPAYNRCLKPLFARLLVVAFGEVDDGAFPSLAIGATRNLFEDLWQQAQETGDDQALAVIDRFLPRPTHFRKYFDRVLSEISRVEFEASRSGPGI